MSEEQVTDTSLYGYVPTSWICYTFVILFGISTALHLGEAVYFKPRLYWLIPTMVICGVGEVIGWAGRLINSKHPTDDTAFMTQLITTILAPTFLTAALYTLLGGIIKHLGSQYSRLSPRAYIIVFVIADILALVVQSLGGAIAAGANNDRAKSNLGSNIMVGGIFFQMAGLSLYAILAMEVFLRFHLQKPISGRVPSRISFDSEEGAVSDKPFTVGGRTMQGSGVMPPRIGMMVIGLVLATILVFIRTIYRSIELLGGWDGKIITTQIYFNLLDATPIVLAMFVLNVFHPGYLLQE